MNYDIDAMRKCLQDAANREPKPDTPKSVVAALHPELIALRNLRWSWKQIAAELDGLWDGKPDNLRILHTKEKKSRPDNSSAAGPKAPKKPPVKPKASATAPVERPDGGAASSAASAEASPAQASSDISPDATRGAIATRGQAALGPFTVQRDIFGDEADA